MDNENTDLGEGRLTAAARYTALEAAREPYLARAEEAAKYTIPSLFPPRGHNGSAKLRTPFQSVGARGVNNLASKLLLTLLPPNSPFFRLELDDIVLAELEEDETGESDTLKTDLERALSRVENRVMLEIESTRMRIAIFEAIKQLIVAGNALVHTKDSKDSGGGMRVFRMNQYVVDRDPEGSALEIIVKERISIRLLPDDVRKQIEESHKHNEEHHADSMKPGDSVSLYTWVKRDGNTWRSHQEAGGIVLDETNASYTTKNLPWLPLTWVIQTGDDYGRGFVEEYLGDLKSVEGLSKALVEGSALASRVLWMVNPNSTTKKRDIERAQNGAVIDGDADDVGMLKVDKTGDMMTAKSTLDEIRRELSLSFLLNSSVQRAGERVTAEEIRFMASELEDALGGVYSRLSQEFQMRLVLILLNQLQRENKLPVLPDKTVKPVIVTGLEALGRGHDLRKLDVAMQGLGNTVPPGVLDQHINWSEYIQRRLVAAGVDAQGLVKSPEEVAAAVQQQQQQQMKQTMAEKATAPIAKAGAEALTQ